jgi:drug/metabolite transporter (DMT)-like permease
MGGTGGTGGTGGEGASRESHVLMQRRRAGIAAVVVTTLAWAFPPLILNETKMAPLAFASYRLWTGVAIYAVMFIATGRRLHWPTLKRCAPGGLIFAADVGLAFTAFHYTSVADATIIGAVSTVTIMIGAAIWFGERMQRSDLWLVAASIAGVVVVAIGSAGSPHFSIKGDLAASFSVFTWTGYWMFSKRARESIGALEYMASVMLVAAVAMTVVAPLTGASMSWPSGSEWIALFAVALFAGAVGHSLVAWSHQHLEAWLASLILNSQPLVSVVLAWVILGQTITAVTAAGGAMVLASTTILVMREGRTDPGKFEPEPTTPAI